MSLNELRAVCWSLNEPKTKMGLSKSKWDQKTLNIFKVTLHGLKMGLYELNEIKSNNTAQKMKFSIKDFFSKCDREFGHIYWWNP